MIVGISGFSSVGKDSVADVLVKNHGAVRLALADEIKRIVSRVFGWPPDMLWGHSERRNVLDMQYPRKHEWVDGKCACCGFDKSGDREVPESCFLTPRYALQTLGTEWGRNCYSDVWVELAVRTARLLLKEDLGELKVEKIHATRTYTQQRGVDYCSYDESREARIVVIPDVRFRSEVEGLKAAGAKLVRVTRPGFERPQWDHPSETEQVGIGDDEFDYVLRNDGTLAELEGKVGDMMRALEDK